MALKKNSILVVIVIFLPLLAYAQRAGEQVKQPTKKGLIQDGVIRSKGNPNSRNADASFQNMIIANLIDNMVYIEGGSFIMGNNSLIDATPHHVKLTSFSIGKYEVTQEEWETIMGYNPSSNKGAKNPVDNVSWNDCMTFINKLVNITGKQFRLPTEAEWEYAARGGVKESHFVYSGNNDVSKVAWYKNNSGGKTHRVGSKKANILGLYDMSGNVQEWCIDRYGEFSSEKQNNPQGPSSGNNRVQRGGSWLNSSKYCTVTYRNNCSPDSYHSNMGFRLAL